MGPRCDICNMKAGWENMHPLQCQVCGVVVHEECYGVQMLSDEYRARFHCWGCMAIGKMIDGRHQVSRKRMMVKQENRPHSCVLCSHDKGIHAMTALYDIHGTRGKHVILPDGKPAWVHAACALSACIMTEGAMYGCNSKGEYEESTSSDESEDDSVLERNGPNKKTGKDEPPLPSEISVQRYVIAGITDDDPDKHRLLMRFRRELKCDVCGSNDKGKHCLRVPLQCSAGNENQYKDHQQLHGLMDRPCTQAMHVGCARWGKRNTSQRFYFFPGSDTLPKPICELYCFMHAQQVDKKHQKARKKELQQRDNQRLLQTVGYVEAGRSLAGAHTDATADTKRGNASQQMPLSKAKLPRKRSSIHTDTFRRPSEESRTFSPVKIRRASDSQLFRRQSQNTAANDSMAVKKTKKKKKSQMSVPIITEESVMVAKSNAAAAAIAGEVSRRKSLTAAGSDDGRTSFGTPDTAKRKTLSDRMVERPHTTGSLKRTKSAPSRDLLGRLLPSTKRASSVGTKKSAPESSLSSPTDNIVDGLLHAVSPPDFGDDFGTAGPSRKSSATGADRNLSKPPLVRRTSGSASSPRHLAKTGRSVSFSSSSTTSMTKPVGATTTNNVPEGKPLFKGPSSTVTKQSVGIRLCDFYNDMSQEVDSAIHMAKDKGYAIGPIVDVMKEYWRENCGLEEPEQFVEQWRHLEKERNLSEYVTRPPGSTPPSNTHQVDSADPSPVVVVNKQTERKGPPEQTDNDGKTGNDNTNEDGSSGKWSPLWKKSAGPFEFGEWDTTQVTRRSVEQTTL